MPICCICKLYASRTWATLQVNTACRPILYDNCCWWCSVRGAWEFVINATTAFHYSMWQNKILCTPEHLQMHHAGHLTGAQVVGCRVINHENDIGMTLLTGSLTAVSQDASSGHGNDDHSTNNDARGRTGAATSNKIFKAPRSAVVARPTPLCPQRSWQRVGQTQELQRARQRQQPSALARTVHRVVACVDILWRPWAMNQSLSPHATQPLPHTQRPHIHTHTATHTSTLTYCGGALQRWSVCGE